MILKLSILICLMSFALTALPDPVPQGSAEFDINPNESTSTESHQSVMLQNGNVVVAYKLSATDFYFQEFDQAHAKVGSLVTTSSVSMYSIVAVPNTSTFLVNYNQGTLQALTVCTQKYETGGTTVGSLECRSQNFMIMGSIKLSDTQYYNLLASLQSTFSLELMNFSDATTTVKTISLGSTMPMGCKLTDASGSMTCVTSGASGIQTFNIDPAGTVSTPVAGTTADFLKYGYYIPQFDGYGFMTDESTGEVKVSMVKVDMSATSNSVTVSTYNDGTQDQVNRSNNYVNDMTLVSWIGPTASNSNPTLHGRFVKLTNPNSSTNLSSIVMLLVLVYAIIFMN